VLVRTNAQTQAFEQALAEAGLPFAVRGAERFFDRAEVRQGVSLLRAAARSASADDDDPAAQVRPVLAGIGLTPKPPAGRGTARERWESLEALAQLAEDFLAATPAGQPSLAGLAAELATRSAIGHAPELAGITLASLHAAKGLEWDAVFLAGLVDGTVPIIYAQTPEAIAEERRLLYVGVTRAREHLFLSWALARAAGGRRIRKPSRFLDDVLPASAARASAQRGKSARKERTGLLPGGPAGQLVAADDPVFAGLREWRLATAREQSVPAYVVFSDATLQVIAARRPATLRELAAVPGVGAVKLDRYGAAVLQVCSQAGKRSEEHG
jgi:DNA helicase-2/ATP-dependent DNA helicase PcrA